MDICFALRKKLTNRTNLTYLIISLTSSTGVQFVPPLMETIIIPKKHEKSWETDA